MKEVQKVNEGGPRVNRGGSAVDGGGPGVTEGGPELNGGVSECEWSCSHFHWNSSIHTPKLLHSIAPSIANPIAQNWSCRVNEKCVNTKTNADNRTKSNRSPRFIQPNFTHVV